MVSFFKNKTILPLISFVILSACGYSGRKPTTHKQPVLLTQNYFIAYYQGEVGNSQRIEMILYNWADGNLNANLVLEEECIDLIGEINLDESVILKTTDRQKGNLKMQFNFSDPCHLEGTLSKGDGVEKIQLTCNTDQPFLSGTFEKRDSASIATIVVYTDAENSKTEYQLLHFVEEGMEVKMFGFSGKEKKLILDPASNSKLASEPFLCDYTIVKDQANRSVLVTATANCKNQLQGEYARIQ